MRETQSGQRVCTFGLATNREWMTSDGRKKNSAEYHELVAWAQLAEICEKYVRKGKLLYIEGYLKTRSWDTPEGIRKFKTEVVVQDMIMLEKRKDAPDFEGYSDASEGNNDFGGEFGDDNTGNDSTGDDDQGNDDQAESEADGQNENETTADETTESEPEETKEVEDPAEEEAPAEDDEKEKNIIDEDLGL